jgi:hypothetical protein
LVGEAKITAELAEQRKQLAEQKKALEDAQATISDLEKKVDTAATVSEENDWTNRLRIYGFTDVGANRTWVGKRGLLATGNSANATSFVIGNLNFYFDAQPIKGWRSLVEIRFTNAPQGEIQSYGGLAGTFKRTNTMQPDPNAATFFSNQWNAGVVLERAHLDWTDIPYFKVRVGNFFTPFGIWNVDHGSPTLIANQMPGMITARLFPIRQTGLQVYGNAFAGEWELGYHATMTNGRQELSNFAFDDDRGFGARVYANNEKGEATIKLGASFYTGRTKDQEVDITSFTPITFQKKSTFDYREVVGGLDFSLDVGRTRIRAEAAASSVTYDDGKHEPALVASVTPQFRPNMYIYNGYLLVAHQLPWIPLELYGNFDLTFGPSIGVGDTAMGPGVGFNVRFNKAVIWKNQVTESIFADTRGRSPGSDLKDLNALAAYSRLVLVF